MIRAGFSISSLGYRKMPEPVCKNALNNLPLPLEMVEDTAEKSIIKPSFFIFQLSTPSNYILKIILPMLAVLPLKIQ